ncbi:MAG: glutaredoxin family protein [Pyrinomonadaceae bacterium]
MKTQVIIYSRPGCHLCDVAKSAIRDAGCEGYYVLDEVNIEGDAALLPRYKNDIPVITFDGVEAFRHRINPDEFREALMRHKQRD